GMIIKPSTESVEVVKGPNIGSMPIKEELKNNLQSEIIMKTEDNITTDDIMPAGAKILPLRSNIPKISEYVYSVIDEDFVNRAKKAGKSVIVGGEKYGQGSSREHAAIAPMYLGVQAVVAKSFARIHKKNLINFGIIPLAFENKEDYDSINQGDIINIANLKDQIMRGTVEAEIQGKKINLKLELSEIDRQVLKAGGKLNFIKKKN
ncbi:MAG: aconitate hydratase, partial [Bacillota bacterium]|nr:aconitate hydratase [Bacillota bacterium]